MKRTESAAPQVSDLAALVTAITALDIALKQGIVIGVYEGSMEVSDEHVKSALRDVNAQIDNVTKNMENLVRAVSVAATPPSSLVLQ